MGVAFRITVLGGATVVLAAIGLAGCGGGGTVLFGLQGKVLDDGVLTPVHGARVVADTGQTGTTDASGQFLLDGVPAGAQSLTVAAMGYQTRSVPISGSSAGLSVGTVYLRPAALQGSGNVTGVVTEAGVPADAAALQAGGRQALSKRDGTYALYNVPIGKQTVVAMSADGQSSGSASVIVGNQTSVTANIALSNSPPPPPPLP